MFRPTVKIAAQVNMVLASTSKLQLNSEPPEIQLNGSFTSGELKKKPNQD